MQKHALIIAEHDNQYLKPSALYAINAATQLAERINILICGYQCKSVVEQAQQIAEINEIIYIDNEQYAYPLAENLAEVVVQYVKTQPYHYLIAAADSFGKNNLPRIAALLDIIQISDVTKIIDAHTFMRPIYAGNALEKVQCMDDCMALTIRTTAFAAVEIDAASINKAPAKIIEFNYQATNELSKFIKLELNQSARPELTNAKIVVSGGRGIQSKENFALIEQLADKLHAAVGASRAAVDAGFVPNDYQVGQTGKIVAPNLYIAVGISGAIQHVAGMKDSKIIVAINKDAEAPIFQIADYGIVGDLFEIVPQLIEKL